MTFKGVLIDLEEHWEGHIKHVMTVVREMSENYLLQLSITDIDRKFDCVIKILNKLNVSY